MNPSLFFIAVALAMAIYFGYHMVRAQIELYTERKLRIVDQDHLEQFRAKYYALYARHEQVIEKWQHIAMAVKRGGKK